MLVLLDINAGDSFQARVMRTFIITQGLNILHQDAAITSFPCPNYPTKTKTTEEVYAMTSI